MTILDRLISQASNPKGYIGRVMLHIMNSAHSGIMEWGLRKINFSTNDLVLDIGCGGGETIKKISQILKNREIYGIDYSHTAVENSINKNEKDVKSGKVKIKKASCLINTFYRQFF